MIAITERERDALRTFGRYVIETADAPKSERAHREAVIARFAAQIIPLAYRVSGIVRCACTEPGKVARDCPIHDVGGNGCHECGEEYCYGGWSCDCKCHPQPETVPWEVK